MAGSRGSSSGSRRQGTNRARSEVFRGLRYVFSVHCSVTKMHEFDLSPTLPRPGNYDDYMGCWSTLKIGNVAFGSWKNGVDDSIMVLFSESDKLIGRIAPDPDCGPAREESELSPSLSVQYVTTVQVLKRRLDFLGFTLETCRRVFEIAKAQEIVDLRKRIEDFSRRSADSGVNTLIEHYSRRIDLLSKSDAVSWLFAFREAFLAAPDVDPELLSELASSLLHGALSVPSSFVPGGTRFWFPGGHDERFRLRLELEALQNGEAVLDISDLVDGGYYSASDPLASWSREWISAKEREALHLIVLTEGSTDKFVLESALPILRPELTDYISFMDFAAFKVEGGASFLSSMVRSFAGAGIRDRVVAVFDNDTAGCAAECALSKHPLPENIKVIRYPDIDLARNYPTLGPTGKVAMDVNGSAASIELYLGRDVLAEPSGELVPVQWKGFDPTMRRYQGKCWTREHACTDSRKSSASSGNPRTLPICLSGRISARL